MGRSRRSRPNRLAEKLLQIRLDRDLSQNQMISLLEFDEFELTQGSLSNYELGKREPTLGLLLRYARFANVTVDVLIDDLLDLPLREKS